MSDQQYNVVLFEPVIPQNTGSIARLCACTGAMLHLIHPLGFSLEESRVKRAGLDYWPFVAVRNHPTFDSFISSEGQQQLFFFSKFATRSYFEVRFEPPTYLVFGNETKGLPDFICQKYSERFFQIPMRTDLVRSLNLAQCAAIVLYEALRQNHWRVEGP